MSAQSDQSESRPSSAGECAVCGRHADKRYGGMGRYVAMCIDCWERACALDLLRADDALRRAFDEDHDA